MISIKQASRENIKELKDVLNHADIVYNTKEAGVETMCETLFQHSNVYIFYENKSPAAFSACALRDTHIEITAFYIAEEFTQKGYEKLLLDHMEEKPFEEECIFLIKLLKENKKMKQFFSLNQYDDLSKNNENKLCDISWSDDMVCLYKTVVKKQNQCCCQQNQ